MLGSVSLYALVNLAVVLPVVTIFYTACVFIDENGGYSRYWKPVLGTTTGVLAVVTAISLGFYGTVLTDMANKIDSIAISTDNFPNEVKDCTNSTEIANIFQHYGIQATASIAGTALQTFEDAIVTILLLFTAVPTLLFWLSTRTSFSKTRRWRLFWFGFYWILALEIFCFIVMIFYDTVAISQEVMKAAGGVVDQALKDCDELWEALVLFTHDTSPACDAEIKKQMCVVHVHLKNFIDDDLWKLFASSMSVGILLPLLTLALGLGVFFTWIEPKGTQVFEMTKTRNRRYAKVASNTDW